MEQVAAGGGGDLNDAMEVASSAIEKIRTLLQDSQAKVTHVEMEADSGSAAVTAAAKLPEGYADRWAVCAMARRHSLAWCCKARASVG